MRYLLTGLILVLSLPAFGATQTRTSAFAYDPNTGLLIQEVIEPDTPALRLQTDYGYDAYGNKTSVTVSGADIVTRTSTTTYDANGQFPISSANALGHTETRQYDARFGTVTSLTGPNSLTTSWQYDGFGRKIQETRADGTQTLWDTNAGGPNCWGAAYAVYVTTSGVPNSGTCYDMLNREVRSYAQGFDGTYAYKDTQYDSLGRVSQVSRPYYTGGTPHWTTYAYDSLSRVTLATEPDSSHTATGYNGLTTTLTDANSHTTTRIKNSQGQLVQVTDAKGFNIYYSYDPFGNLTQTTDAKNNVTTLTYDLRGRKTDMVDPDMGHWTYQYDVLGQLKIQTDAKNQVTTMTYDKLGRMLTRGEPDLISTWTYDTAAKGIGKLASVTAGNGFSRSYTYDSLGRPYQTTTSIDQSYTSTITYDAYGRPDSTTYPTGFATQNSYNAQGYLTQVVNKATPSVVYWQGTSQDAEGHLLSETLGDGLTRNHSYTPATGRISNITVSNAGGYVLFQNYGFDPVGNLNVLYDGTMAWFDSFNYDELNRLLGRTRNTLSGPPLVQSYQYDAIGNLTYKSDQGTYSYGTQPHAVATVAGSVNNTYSYDANGNLQSGAGRNVTWNSFNMVYQITQGKNTLSYAYDADHSRIREEGPNGTTIYLNPRLDSGQHFEKVINSSGVTEYKHYLYAGGIPVGVYTSRSNGVNDTQYFYTDHLGSILAVTNQYGVVVARYDYDPFGNRTLVAGGDATDHGFTGHEHMEEVGLINMNGRIYDPALARFMSADPNIQAPGNGQSFNRYSYVLNNPLSYTDPSGFSWWTKFRDNVLKPVVAIGAAFVLGPGSWYALTSNALANSIIAGAVAGGIATGSNQGALAGGVSGGLFNIAGGIGYADSAERYAAHAFAGCAGGEVGGGGCGRGAASAVAGKWATNATDGNFVATAVAGGTVSVIGGGKFANGAMTSSFGYMFNYCSDGHCTTELEQKLYDWWPGYKAGTCLYNASSGGGCTGWEILDGASVGVGGAAKGLSAGLSGGANSVFWSGRGAMQEAMELGTTLEKTPVGGALNWINKNVLTVPSAMWRQASAIFANNAEGTAQVVLRNPRVDSIWNTVEKPILNQRGINIIEK